VTEKDTQAIERIESLPEARIAGARSSFRDSQFRRFRDVETAEEEAFSALLATRAATKASAIACVKHVADCGLATNEVRSSLAMQVESPLVS
jgi:hypothetical protein